MRIADAEGVHGRAAVLACSSPKTSTGKILPHRRPQSRLQTGQVARPGHMTHLEERAAHSHPETLLNSHFICVGVPAPAGAISVMPRGLGRDGMSTLKALRGAPATVPASGAPSGSPPHRPLERRAREGGVPPWGCGPRPLLSASLMAPLGKNRQHVRGQAEFDTANVTLFKSVSPLWPTGGLCPKLGRSRLSSPGPAG